jgi:copper chaperone CopZ
MKKIVLLALALSLFGQFDSAAAKGKQTPKSQKAEDVCVFQSASCLKNCDSTPQMTSQQFCRNQCANRMNECLNKVKAVSANPETQKQTVKQNPAAAGQGSASNKGGADKQGIPKSGNKK